MERGDTRLKTITLVVEECVRCGTVFGMTQDTKDRRRSDHEMFYCPSGHPQYYTGKSDRERLKETRKKLAAMTDCCASRRQALWELQEHLQHVRSGYQGAIVKERNRIRAEPRNGDG